MLVLSRKRGEQVVIGSGIRVTVLAVKGNRVRLGFDGPAEIAIHREEVHRRIARLVVPSGTPAGSAAILHRACHNGRSATPLPPLPGPEGKSG